MIEDRLLELIAAIKDNTDALRSCGGSAPVKPAAAPKGAKGKPAKETPKDDLEDESGGSDDDDLNDTPPAKPEKAKKPTLDDIRNHIRAESERLKADVSVEAAAKHKAARAKVIKGFGADTIADIKEKDIPAALAAIKAINVEETEESGDDDL